MIQRFLSSALRAVLFIALCICCMGNSKALEYTVAAPEGHRFARASSVEAVYRLETPENVDRSKSAALIPPAFGSPSADLPDIGEYLTPNLVQAPASAIFLSADITTVVVKDAPMAVEISQETPPPVALVPIPAFPAAEVGNTPAFTEVTSDLYYGGGYLGTLRIPNLGVTVRVYEGTDSTQLAKGAGHFPETSIWDGNCCIAAHNRGTNSYFGKIHTLNLGDKITLTTKIGTRNYAVTSVSKVSETDTSGLTASSENMITLYTCVQNQSSYRWCVKAVEAS